MEQQTILYVDDEVDNLQSFKAVFRRYYKVLLAESGQKALAVLSDHSADVQLIISDQRMPGMTGVELLERVRLDYPDILRIILTGYTDMESIINAINKGKIYHYVTKPWKIEGLKLIIDQALNHFDLQEQNKQLVGEKQKLLIRQAQMEKENIEAQFEILKNQINPHFLFNSMNILYALIQQSQEKALEFTTKFSKLFRTMLDFRDQHLIGLDQEITFVEGYLYLQKMRFADSLVYEIILEEEPTKMSLPPFALQLLVENSIKHNIVSKDKPLKVRIKQEGTTLKVENNLQLRTEKPDSTKVGLNNLKARYRLIANLEPLFEEMDGVYVAQLPLIPEG